MTILLHFKNPKMGLWDFGSFYAPPPETPIPTGEKLKFKHPKIPKSQFLNHLATRM